MTARKLSRRSGHTGLTERIRALLRRQGRAMSTLEMSSMLDAPRVQISRALKNMMGRTGGIVHVDTESRPFKYALAGTMAAVQRRANTSGKIAGRITIPQYRYGSTRLG